MTQVQWVKYFYEMARFASQLPGSKFPEMQCLADVSEQFLRKHSQTAEVAELFQRGVLV